MSYPEAAGKRNEHVGKKPTLNKPKCEVGRREERGRGSEEVRGGSREGSERERKRGKW